MNCTVDKSRPHEATQRFTWAWGEEGATCDEHRAVVESQAAQLQRSVAWAPLDVEPRTDPGRRELGALLPRRPALQETLEADLRLARLAATQAQEVIRQRDATIGHLQLRVSQLEAEVEALQFAKENAPNVVEGKPPG